MKMKLFLAVGLLAGSLGLSLFSATTSYATSNNQTSDTLSAASSASLFIFASHEPGHIDEPDENEAQEVTTCAVEGIGWMICPVVREISHVVDFAYGVVGQLLTVSPLMTTGDHAHTYTVWTMMRNIANVAFVIAFLIIIFSQLTSVGLNNYGIKKMLPRLIVAAILVNASYWICAIAVDISNILGASINGVFKGIAIDAGNAGMPAGPNNAVIGGESGWAGITAAILAGTVGILYIGLSALLPALLAAVVAIITVFIVLSMRQALIILLVIVSPLAFVAYLLPNTESLFKKWYALFKTLLLMYPIISLIFGASALASSIILATPSTEDNKDYYIALQVMGAAIAIVPLALTPILMKTAGGLLGRVGAFVNNPNKGPFDRMRKGAEGVRKRQEGRRAIRELNGEKTMGFGKYNRAAKRGRIESGIESEKKRAEAKYLANKTVNDADFRNKAAGGLQYGGPDAPHEATERARTSAQDVLSQIEISEVKAASAQIENASIPNDMVQAIAMGEKTYIHKNADGSQEERNVQFEGTGAMLKAAIQMQAASGQAEKITDLVDKYGSEGGDNGKILAQTLTSSSNRPGWIGAAAIDNIKTGNAVGNDKFTASETMMEAAINSGAYSPEKMATSDAEDLGMMANYIHKTSNDPTFVMDDKQRASREAISTNAVKALTDPILSTKLAKRGANIEAIAVGNNAAGSGNPTRTWSTQQSPTTSTAPQPTRQPTINVQSAAPTVLNITHNMPPNANPGNYRTTPPSGGNISGDNRSSGGVILPDDYRQPPSNP